jgi:hypothetical protein
MVKLIYCFIADGLRKRLVGFAGLQSLGNMVGAGPPKHNNVQEGIGSESIGSVNGDTGGLTSGVQPRNNSVLTVLIDGQYFAGILCGDAAHIVMDSGEDRDRILGNIDARKDGSRLRNAWKALVENGSWQVRELQVYVVLVGPATSPISDLHGHGAGDDITRGQVLCGRGIALHEALTIGV